MPYAIAYGVVGAWVSQMVVRRYGRGCPWWSYPLGAAMNFAAWPVTVWACVTEVSKEESE